MRPGRLFGFSPLPNRADFDAVMWEPADKPQTKLVQADWQIYKAESEVLVGLRVELITR